MESTQPVSICLYAIYWSTLFRGSFVLWCASISDMMRQPKQPPRLSEHNSACVRLSQLSNKLPIEWRESKRQINSFATNMQISFKANNFPRKMRKCDTIASGTHGAISYLTTSTTMPSNQNEVNAECSKKLRFLFFVLCSTSTGKKRWKSLA